ncbi:MAG TPA: hypothetical protein P5205_10365 [Candidatus Paceibacterota bacterium]|nr:hypothetical protein [Verrucomicrobiota bacterium]HSA10758.1 hypothetical protein [Candidatus Paceibacterota bacterium]
MKTNRNNTVFSGRLATAAAIPGPTTPAGRRSFPLALKLALLLTLLAVALPAGATVWTYDFGTGTGSHTSGASTTFLPAPPTDGGTARVRVGTGAGSFNLENPGDTAVGSETELRIVAPTGGSVNKFSIYDYSTPNTTFYVKFTVKMSGTATSGNWYFFAGDGASLSDNVGFTGAQIFTGIRWSFGADTTITETYRSGSSWAALPDSFSKDTVYSVEIYGNNSAAAQNYARSGSQSLAPYKVDMWVNGSLVGDDLAKAQLADDANIDSFMFYGESFAGNAGTIYLDDFEYGNELPVATVVYVDNTGAPPAGIITAGANDVVLAGFRLQPPGSIDFTGLSLTTAGTATASDLSNFRVAYDADNSGTYNAGDSVVSGSGQALANPISFSISGQAGFNDTRRYLVIADVAAGAVGGRTITASIAAGSAVTATLTCQGSAAGNQQTISADDMTMATAYGESFTIDSMVNDATIPTTSQGAQVWQVTFSNPSGNSGAGTITGLAFTQGANNEVADWSTTVLAAELFDGESTVGAGTISATGIAFSGLNVAVADGDSKTLALRISLQSTPGALFDNDKFQFALAGGDVTVSGNAVTTAALSSDQSQNAISVTATRLVFTIVPAFVVANMPFSVTVQAQDANGNRDRDNLASVTITLNTGTGNLSGNSPQSLSSGIKTFSGLAYDTVGEFTLKASGGMLTDGISSTIVARAEPTMTEVIMPQYIQGIASGSSNTKRLPYAFCLSLANLAANATYRYYNQCVVSSDSATTAGAGNMIFATASGSFVRTTSPSLSTAGGYGTFTTDANGNYTGWFITEPSGNTRFATTGNQLYMRIMMNDGAEGTSVNMRLTTPSYATVLPFGTDANTGTGIWGNSSATDKNFVVLYDNAAGSGRPLAATFAESDGVAENTGASYVSFYSGSVDGISGAWGTIIPNSNANGVQCIEQRKLADGSLLVADTDSDGIWPSGATTVNPVGGDATPVVITAEDAPLASTSVTSVTIIGITATTISYTGGSGSQFVLLESTSLDAPLNTWTRAQTQTGTPGSFTITAGETKKFYSIKSE